jgi:CPA2 family monovalent cation:H+ antiporter-2
VTDSMVYPIIIAVSPITIFTTAYLMRLSKPIFNVLEKLLPDKWLYRFNQPRKSDETAFSRKGWGILLRGFFVYMFVLFVVVIAIYLIVTRYLHPLLVVHIGWWPASILSFLLTFLALSPFLKAIMSSEVETSAMLNLWMEKSYNRIYLFLLVALRVIMVFALLMVIINRFIPIPLYINWLIALALFLILSRSKWLLKRFYRIESRFLINMNERQMEEHLQRIEANKGVMELSNMHHTNWLDYKLYTCAFRLRPDSEYEGKLISELPLRSLYNLMVIRIRTKDNEVINIPSGDYRLKPGDSLRLAGRKRQLRKLQEENLLALEFVPHSFMTLHGFSRLEYEKKQQYERLVCAGLPLSQHSPLVGKTLAESHIGAKTKCLVVGLEREGKQLVNPEAAMRLQPGDVVWLIGEEKPISKHIEENVYFI